MPFAYHEPSTLPEAFALLAAEEDSAVLAGGTDLLLQIRRRSRGCQTVVNIKRIAGLDELRLDGAGLTLGALVTFRELETRAEVQRDYPSLSDAAIVVAGVQIRNLATVGGNVANASPSADSVPALVALHAAATIAGPRGERQLPLEDCFTGPGRTVLARDELFTSFRVPRPAPRSGSAYLRLTPRSAMDIAVVSAGALVTLDGDGRCTDCSLALGAVSPVPLRPREAEQSLLGERPVTESLRRAGEIAAAAALPITDIRGTAAYRRAMVRVAVERVLELAVRRAEGRA